MLTSFLIQENIMWKFSQQYYDRWDHFVHPVSRPLLKFQKQQQIDWSISQSEIICECGTGVNAELMVQIDGSAAFWNIVYFGNHLVRVCVHIPDNLLHRLVVLHQEHKYEAKQDDSNAEHDSDGSFAGNPKGNARLLALDNDRGCSGIIVIEKSEIIINFT